MERATPSVTRVTASVDDGEGGRVRVSAELDDRDRLMIDEPDLGGVKDLVIRQRLAGQLLEAIVKQTRSHRVFRRAEARTGPDADAWVAALQLAGFVELQRAHVFARALLNVPPERKLDRVTLAPAAEFTDAVLESLIADSELGSMDRLALDPFDPPGKRLEAMREVERNGPERARWSIAMRDGEPVGFVFNAVAGSAPQLAGWVLLVGTRPSARGKGIAGVLLEASLRDFAESGVSVAMALIDDQNAPSRAAFARSGFVEAPGVLRTFRVEAEQLRRAVP